MKERARRQEDTRRRIAAATAELHEEVGPARTTIAEIARRAGVQRPTVYSNFPEERELFAACQAHFLEGTPPPDPSPAFALPDSGERVRTLLAGFYDWYRRAAPMSSKVQRDRRVVPELDALLADTVDAHLDALAAALADGLGGDTRRVRSLLRVSLDFLTWEQLTAGGLSDGEAAEVMADAVRAVAAAA
jgi:AcrR family transcriptional regulator